MAIYNGSATSVARAGITSIEVNGEAVDVAGDASYDATFKKKEILIGQSGPQGFSLMIKTGSISATIRDAGNMSVAAFLDMDSVPVVMTLASGKTVYGDSLNCTECGEVRTAEATFTLKFEGLVTESSTPGENF